MSLELRALYEQCRRRYPAVDLTLEDYTARVCQVLTTTGAADLHHEELFLAFACSRGDRVAWEHFADEYLPRIRRWAGQACGSIADGEDLSQEIAANLLERGEKLAGYDGRGTLAAWLRIAVSRAAIDRFRKRKPQVSLEDMQERGSSAAEPVQQPPVEQQIDARWVPALMEHVSKELARLGARDRLLLGLYYVDQVPLKRIAAHFDVHESTASRWLDGVRNTLRRRIERGVRARFGFRPREMEALWRLAGEDGAVQLEAVLKESSQAGSGGAGDK